MTETLHPDLGAALGAHRMAGLADRAKGRGPAARNQASAIGWPCPSGARYLALLRTVQPDPTSPELQAIFEEGDAQEEIIARQLTKDGWGVIELERPNKVWPDLQISGRIDREVTIPKAVAEGLGLDSRTHYIGEFKTMSGPSFEKATSIAAMAGAHQPWLRSYPTQLVMYLWLEGRPAGIFILKCKQTNEFRFLPMHMDEWIGLAANAVERCKEVNAHIAAGTLPPVTGYEQAVCGRCRVRSACLPGEAGPGADVILDEAMVEELQRRDDLAAAAAQYKESDEYVKSQIKALAGGKAGLWICQDWELEVKLVAKHFKAKPAQPESDRVDTQVGIRRLRGASTDEPAGE
jgi:hypothetical protein